MSEQTENRDKLVFAEETSSPEPVQGKPWKVLIVDDEEPVHNITRVVLRNFTFSGKTLEFVSAYSAKEAKEKIVEHTDTALILLDVIMENEHSGLEVVKYIRETIGNREVRIVLRTGHPGRVPEKSVIIDYDINDYKEKTDLSSQKLVTTVISSLRSYMDLQTIIKLNRELEDKVVERTKQLQEANDILSETIGIMQTDLEAGKKTQFKLLPAGSKTFGSYSFHMKLLPSLYLSGDFLDYFEIDSSHTGFYFADVCGHGAASAFITVMLKTFIDSELLAYRNESSDVILHPEMLAQKLNSNLLSENLDKHLTFFYGVLDMEENTIECVNCGHYPHPVIFDGSSAKSEVIESGVPIALFEFADYKSSIIKLPEKFLMLFLSDGILETLDEELVQDKQKFIESQLNNIKDSFDTIVSKIAKGVADDNPDDITFLLIKKDSKNE